MAKTVTIEMHNGKELRYADVGRIEEAQYQVKIYDETGNLLATVDKGGIKNLFTEESN